MNLHTFWDSVLIIIIYSIITFLFFIWSKLIWVSLSLLLFFGLITDTFFTNFIHKNVNKNILNLLKISALIFSPIYFTIFVRTFFFDVYHISSSSMERTLCPDDYILINKFLYGAKVPNNKKDIPLIGKFFKENSSIKNYNYYEPLKAFKDISREDIVVFKSTNTNDNYFVKRIIGVPGDILKIKDTKVYINNFELIEREEYCFNYIKKNNYKSLDIKNLSNREFNALSYKEKQSLLREIKDNSFTFSRYSIFPITKQKEWTVDNYGEIIIPKKGNEIIINNDNYDFYEKIIKNYENINFDRFKTKKYKFKNNYYFVMGDNRHNSVDSRNFGLVPESYIQGKVVTKF